MDGKLLLKSNKICKKDLKCNRLELRGPGQNETVLSPTRSADFKISIYFQKITPNCDQVNAPSDYERQMLIGTISSSFEKNRKCQRY